TLTRSKDKMEKVLGGIAQMGRAPAALFIVDTSHEHIALAEARRLGITTFAMVDTNSDPSKVDFSIPANDDATKSISIITNYLVAAIIEGLEERAQNKEQEQEEAEEEITERMRGLDLEEDEKEGGNAAKSGKAPTRRRTTSGPAGQGGRKPAAARGTGVKK